MTEPKYDGAAWRSRFLRAPKYSLQLAARPDFVPLATVADVKLGLKTGCDDFFFLEATKAEKKPLLLATPLKGVKNVQGSDGWRGGISSRDLRLAVKNPKQLFRDDGERGFLIHPVRATYYLAARDRSPHGDLAGYVAIAEAKGIDRLAISAGQRDRW